MRVPVSQITMFGRPVLAWFLAIMTPLVLLGGTIIAMYFSRWWGSQITFIQGFAWGTAAVVSLILWPAIIVANNRVSLEETLGVQAKLGTQVQIPAVETLMYQPSTQNKWLQLLIFLVGGLSLFLLVGAQSIASLLYSFLELSSSNGLSFCSLIQLFALLVSTVPALLVMYVLHKRVEVAPVGSAEREEAMLHASWWGSVLMGWGIILCLGQLFAWVIMAHL